jgi:hypothetical protein
LDTFSRPHPPREPDRSAKPRRNPVTWCFAGILEWMPTVLRSNTEPLGKRKDPCNDSVARILQPFCSITDLLGKEYRLPREVLLTSSGSGPLPGRRVLSRGQRGQRNFTCKLKVFVRPSESEPATASKSGKYRRPWEEILMAPGSFTDAVGKEYRLPREVLLMPSGRNTDGLGKFISIISCKTAYFQLRCRFPCMYECMYCSCCLTRKRPS